MHSHMTTTLHYWQDCRRLKKQPPGTPDDYQRTDDDEYDERTVEVDHQRTDDDDD
ncbi:hypothetical protein M408DRAFT_29854 [Serendipita vermifera MAFF 305830]|uniref:Uncharacterized protein n=1 Tax=Serendipita vermifera MAFF 305830 TaxID=933852 RepID=A0A0C2WUP1_SERVB|nr:hypothetical protein M408DRAFT_29854 [Serendipita vermifera MAFF 305830]